MHFNGACSIEKLTSLIKQPFPDVHEAALRCLCSLATLPWGQRYIASEPGKLNKFWRGSRIFFHYFYKLISLLMVCFVIRLFEFFIRFNFVILVYSIASLLSRVIVRKTDFWLIDELENSIF